MKNIESIEPRKKTSRIDSSRLRKILVSLIMSIILTLPTSISYTQDYMIDTGELSRDDYLDYMIELIQSDYKYDITEEALYNGIYKGLFDALDKHSVYFEPKEYQMFNVSTSGEFGGIGITIELNEEGYLTIVSPIKNTPGFRAGLSTGDVVKEVNGQDIKDWSLERSLEVMRGKPGTEILLGIQKAGDDKITDVRIIREIIKIVAVEHELIDDNIGLISISSFSDNVSRDFAQALRDLKGKNVKGLVIDLRNNPGGSLREVLNIADLLVDRGNELLYVDVKGQNDEVFNSVISPLIKDMPMVVLINESSASASEILSGVLKDYDLATIIGTNSYGKGTVQNIYDLPNGAGLKITIAEYLTPSRNKIDGVGISPDIIIKDEKSLVESHLQDISSFAPMKESLVYKYLGQSGLNIYGAQQRLDLLGYDLEINAVLDQKTIDALKSFQSTHGLKADGVLGSHTVKTLDNIFIKPENEKDKVMDKALEVLKSAM